MTINIRPLRTSRRSVLEAGAGGLVAAGVLPAWALGQGVNPFTQGVASGDPSPDGFVIWTRLAPTALATDGRGGITGEHPVRWAVAADERMDRVVARGTVAATERFNHSVHVEVSGLKPDRPYWYCFYAQGWQSTVGRSRTLPLPSASLDHLRVAFVSCSNWEEGWFTAYSRIVDEDLHLVVFLGDYIYEYNNKGKKAEGRVRLHVGPEATDLASYRLRYSLYRTDPDLQRLHAAAPALITWDDHEVENDYAGQWSEHANVSADTFLVRRRAAYQVFYENMPLRARSKPRGDAMRVYDRFRFGNLVEMPLLDGRQYRDREACPKGDFEGGHVVPESCTERTDPARTMLGATQERWLFDGFRRSDARWKRRRPRSADRGTDPAGHRRHSWTLDRWLGWLSRLPHPHARSGEDQWHAQSCLLRRGYSLVLDDRPQGGFHESRLRDCGHRVCWRLDYSGCAAL